MILSKVEELIRSQTINDIKCDILKILDEKIKNRYYINKHFQNAIMNYFLEDYGSLYLREQYSKQSNREVRRYLTALATQRGYKGTKYIIMINIYFDIHEELGLVDEYRQLFRNVALQKNDFPEDSQEFISQAWKKAFGLFVLAHSFDRSLGSIFDIWNSLFIEDKIFRKRKPNSKNTSIQLVSTGDSLIMQKQSSSQLQANSQILDSTDVDSNNNNCEAASQFSQKIIPPQTQIYPLKINQIKQEPCSFQAESTKDSNSNSSSNTLNYIINNNNNNSKNISNLQQIQQQQQQLPLQQIIDYSKVNQNYLALLQQQQLQQQQQQQQLFLQFQLQQQQQQQQQLLIQAQAALGIPFQHPQTLSNNLIMNDNFQKQGYLLSNPSQIILNHQQVPILQQSQQQQQLLALMDQYQQQQKQGNLNMMIALLPAAQFPLSL